MYWNIDLFFYRIFQISTVNIQKFEISKIYIPVEIYLPVHLPVSEKYHCAYFLYILSQSTLFLLKHLSLFNQLLFNNSGIFQRRYWFIK